MTRTASKHAFLLLALLTTSALAQTTDGAPTDAPGTLATATEAEAPGELRRYAVRSGGGCVAGAIAGTLVPGVGNAVGCVIGALGGWLLTWMQEPDDLLDADE